MVDHNLHKGISHKLAVDNSIPTARLPIDKFMDMKTRKVLTIDHVFRILGSLSEGKTWQEALIGVMPPRKGAVVIKGEEGEATDKNGKSEKEETATTEKAKDTDNGKSEKETEENPVAEVEDKKDSEEVKES